MNLSLVSQDRGVRASLLYHDDDPNQSSLTGATILPGRGAVDVSFLRIAFTASADVGTRLMRLQVLDADGEVRHQRSLGSVVADGTLDLAIPFEYPYPAGNDGEIIVPNPNHTDDSGSVDASDAAPNMTITALDTWYPLYAEAAPAAYPVARGTRVYNVSNVVVKDGATDTTVYVEGTDYYVDYARGRIMALTGGDISALDDLAVDFDYADIVYHEVVKQPGALNLPTGWTLVVEDSADIEDTNDDLDVDVYGRAAMAG